MERKDNARTGKILELNRVCRVSEDRAGIGFLPEVRASILAEGGEDHTIHRDLDIAAVGIAREEQSEASSSKCKGSSAVQNAAVAFGAVVRTGWCIRRPSSTGKGPTRNGIIIGSIYLCYVKIKVTTRD